MSQTMEEEFWENNLGQFSGEELKQILSHMINMQGARDPSGCRELDGEEMSSSMANTVTTGTTTVITTTASRATTMSSTMVTTARPSSCPGIVHASQLGPASCAQESPEEKLVKDTTKLKDSLQTVNKIRIDYIRSPELKGKETELNKQEKRKSNKEKDTTINGSKNQHLDKKTAEEREIDDLFDTMLKEATETNMEKYQLVGLYAECLEKAILQEEQRRKLHRF